MLESKVDHEQQHRQEHGRNQDQQGGTLQFLPGRPRRLLGELGEGLFEVVN